MKTENYVTAPSCEEESESITERMKKLQDTCRNCHPLTPLECTTECSVWKIRNENRRLLLKMQNPGFTKELLNTLKNKRRLQVLEMISKRQYSTDELQQQLKRLGYCHSKQTIAQEYVEPLVQSGLAGEDQHLYRATLFGCKLNELVKELHGIEEALPPHSECHEETILSMLLSEPRTHQGLKDKVPGRSVPRVLKRLQKAGLAKTTGENGYVYFFKTRRDSTREEVSTTERRVYENILMEGISASSLAEKTKISLRRTYKYLRRLKGKKLVFSRRRPKSYSLTAEGVQFAMRLEGVHKLLEEALATALLIVKDQETDRLMGSSVLKIDLKEKKKRTAPLTTMVQSKHN
jgi:predicted transcriptional regulator